MAIPRNEKIDEAAGCGLRGLETGRGDAGLAKLGHDGQWRPGPSSAVEDGGAPYKRMVNATREVCQEVFPRHSQPCTNANYTESGNIIIDRICLAWYWLILNISC
jgi:hypothetical protein